VVLLLNLFLRQPFRAGALNDNVLAR